MTTIIYTIYNVAVGNFSSGTRAYFQKYVHQNVVTSW